MGNSFDKAVNKGPPFAPECDPKCEPGPNDLRGNICYKGKCVPLCPVDAKIGEDGKCLCNEDNATYKDDNTKNENDPSAGDGWGYCFKDDDDEDLEEEFKKELEKNPNMTEEEKILLKKKISKKVEKKKKEKKKKAMRFNPVSLFVDRTPKELDERVKAIVKAELKKNPKMTDEELAELISKTTVDVVEELATECEEEYKLVKMILSPKYGNGKWPTKEELKELIDNKNFPWLNSQINQWPEEKSITSCQIISAIKDKITLNNRCIYSDDYPNVKEECNVDCGLGIEVKEKKIIRESNTDFPSLQPCSKDKPTKEFECDSGLICKEDCKLKINMKSFGEARCSKPCDSGDGPGKKTYKVKYVKASQGEPDNMGSCELDEEGKEEGKEYDVTVECNKEKCPKCEVKSKGPYKDNLVDYTGSVNVNGNNKIFTKCLLPKKDGTFKSVDCGGAEGGFNYNKGARAKYNMTYNITKDDYGVQNCTKGKDVIEEGCSVNAFSPDLNPIVGDGGKIVKAGGEECGNECILSDNFPQLVMVEGKECSKTCGGGLQRMRKVVKSKSDAPYCPCKDDPSKCPYEEIPCNTQECIAPCVYGNEGNHVQINEMCPGIKGPNKHVVWDTTKTNPAGGKGMWYDSIANKHYERNNFVKKMRVPTVKPPVGKGLCYQGDKADKTLPCSIEGTEKPIDAKWGPWKFDTYVGLGTTIKSITDKHSNWTHKKINIVKVGATQAGLQVPGSGKVNWPSGGIDKVVEEIKKMGHTLGKTVHLVQKANGKILMYKKGNASGTTGADTWEFQKGAEQNPNFGKKGEHCISEEGLGMAFSEELPGKRYTREVKVFPEYGGRSATEIDGGNNIKVEPYMKKDGINEVKEGTPAKNMTEAECLDYGIKRGYSLLSSGKVTYNYDFAMPAGCFVHGNNIRYNTDTTKSNGIPCGYVANGKPANCVQKGPGGAGYTKYCPVDASLNPEIPIDDIEITGNLGNQDRCYLSNDNESRGKYTMKELEDEAKRKFVRDNELPKYKGKRSNEYRILGPGSRTIYRSKVRDEVTSAKYGGLTTGLWHEKRENFGDVYDRRKNEYDNCEGVSKVLKKIRNNDPSWKSDPIVKQVDCVPIYEWDGNFYKDKESAEAGSNKEEIMRPQHGTNEKGTSAKYPGEYVRKSGKFLLSSTWNNNQYHEGGLDKEGEHKNTGWHYKSGLEGSTKEWIIMETESGDIELVKGIVLQARGNSGQGLQGDFKIKVSRNGDSWKEVGSKSNSKEIFKNNHDTTTHVGRDKYNKHYFTNTEQAKFIKIYDFPAGSSFRIGYIRDKSGVIDCVGGSGLSQEKPWFRFVFNEAKTRDPKLGGKYSEGTAATTKQCPDKNSTLIVQQDSINSGPNGIPVGDLKLLGDGGLKGLKSEMSTKKIGTCGADPTSSGWFSSTSGASVKKWSACVQPDKEGSETINKAYHKDHGGYRYMYRLWQGSDNKLRGYNKNNDNKSYVDSTHSGDANNGSTYTMPSTDVRVQNYDDVNIVRQPCNRGTKGILPKIKGEWASSVPASTEGKSGWSGKVWNLEGGVEGWIDRNEKYKWDNSFHNAVHELKSIKNSSGNIKGPHNYKIEEAKGTNANCNATSWDGWWRGNKAIGGTHGWHSPKRDYWNTSTTNDHWSARYKNMGRFVPVGIKIQPYYGDSWNVYSPTIIRFRFYVRKNNGYVNAGWHWGPEVTMGPFASRDSIKTIILEPSYRIKFKECDHMYIYTRHGRDIKHTAFRINFLLGKIGEGYCIDKGSLTNNGNKNPVDCVQGSSAGVKRTWWTNPGWSKWGGWSRCKYSSGSGGSLVFKKSRTRTRKNYRKGEYKVTPPKHGGRNNCSNVKYDISNKDEKDTNTTKCTRYEYKDTTHCCRYTNHGTSPRWWHKRAHRNATDARNWCNHYMKQYNQPACDWLHTDHNVFGSAGTYFTQTHDWCQRRKANTWHCKANWWGGAYQFK